MATVDEKIVKLTVNNTGFTHKLSEAGSALQKLNQILSRGLGGGKVASDASSINKSISDAKGSLSGFETETRKTSAAFEVLKGAAAVALGNIATMAISSGASLVKSLTFQPLLDGIAEYNLQMGSVQTILANTKSKGEDIKSVTAALDELNHYADLTIYNFGEMTANIGRFTAAGVGLSDSVAAIKGISNLAALSGSSSAQASNAMYQLSQAIASGTVKLMDWNSVVNAGMGGEQFQEALKTTARVHGVAVDAMIEKEGSFRDSLSQGWLTSEIMLETLAGLTGDLSEAQLQEMGYSAEQAKQIYELGQTALHAATEFKTWADVQDAAMESLGSGWAKTFQLIFGDYEQSKALWTEVGNAITGYFDKVSDARNNFVQAWADMGGRTNLINGLRNAITGVSKVLGAVGNAFKSVFKGVSAAQVAQLTQKFADFSKKLIPSEQTLNKLQRAFAGLFSVLHIGKTVIVEVAQFVGNLVGAFLRLIGIGDIGSTLLDWAAKAGDFAVKLDKMVESLNLSTKATELFRKAVDLVKSVFAGFKSGLGFDSSALSETGNGITAAADKIKNAASKFKAAVTEWWQQSNRFEKIKDNLVKIADKLGSGLRKAGELIGTAVDKIYGFIKKLDFGELFKGGIAVGGVAALAGIAKRIRDLVNAIKDALDDGPKDGGLLDGIKETLDGVRSSLEAWQNNLNAKSILAIAVAVGVLTAALYALASLDPKDIAKGIGAIAAMMGSLVASVKALDKLNIKNTVSLKAPALIGIATAVLMLAGAAKILAGIETGDLAKATTAITVLALVLASAAKILGTASAKSVIGAASAVVLAQALVELSVAAALLGTLDTKQLLKGVAAIGAMALAMGVAVRAMGNAGSIGGAMAMVAVGGALVMVAEQLKKIGEMPWKQLAKAGVAMAGAVAGIVLAVRLMGNVGSAKSAIEFAAICASLLLVADSIKKIGEMPWKQLAKAGVAMAGAVAGITLAVKLMENAGSLRATIEFAAICASLLLVANSIKKIGEMPWKQLAKAGVAMAGALAGIVLAVKILNTTGPGALVGAAAILVISLALQKLVGPVKTLGSMDLKSLAKGILSIAAYLLVLVASAKLVQTSIPGLLAMAVALAVITPALNLYASVVKKLGEMDTGTLIKGVLGMAAAFAVLLAASAVAGMVLPGVLALSVAMVAFGLALLPVALALTAFSTALKIAAEVGKPAFEALVDGAVMFTERLPEMVTNIGEALIALGTTLLDGIIVLAPKMGEAATTLITTFCQVIIDSAPSIGEALITIVQTACNVIIECAPSIGEALTTLVHTACQVVRDCAPDMASAFWTLVLTGLQSLSDHAQEIAYYGGEAVANFLQGIADSMPDIVHSGANLIVNFLDGLAEEIPRIADSATNLIIAFINAVADNGPRIADSAMDAIARFIQGMADAIHNNKDKIRTAAKNLLWEFVNAIFMDIPEKALQVKNKAVDIGKGLVGGVKQGISNWWNGLKDWFSTKCQGLIDGAKNLFGIHSPSTEFAKIGKFIPLGFAKGLRETMPTAEREVTYMGLKAFDAMRSSIDKMNDLGLDLNPTITPVLDLTQVQKGATQMSGILAARDVSAQLAGQVSVQRMTFKDLEKAPQVVNNTYEVTFEQTINSPSPLDAAEIRRDTRGLLSEYQQKEQYL